MEENKTYYYLTVRDRQTERKVMLIKNEGLLVNTAETTDRMLIRLKNAKIIAGYLDDSLYYDKDGISMSSLFIKYKIPYMEIFMSNKPGEVFDSDEYAILYYELQE